MLEHERSKAKNSTAKNADEFGKEVAIVECENREDKSSSVNAKALKHIPGNQVQDKSSERRKVESQSIP